ncbi:MAG: hypothetical protein D6781_05975 [Verrucomicrobia bacterium]|nr:MAG: hypothetical protein D6781_05975 [Verrucomicrobiota bacterium]
MDKRSNALVITERPKRLEKIEEIIEKLDRATAQVMIESKFVEVADKDLKNLGVNWTSLSDYKLGIDPVPTLTGSSDIRNPDLDLIAESTEASRTFGAVFTAPEFNVILSALQNQTETRLVSNPTVVTMNNTEAVISIGEQFPIPNYTYNQERGTFEVSGFEYKDIGIIMHVTPQVNNDGLITLKINPQVSSRSGETTFGGAGGATIPIISTRRTETQVAIKDGYTIGLGGLIENVTTDGESKVPVLGDVPVLGRLFRSNNKQMDKRNLLVFVTAKILSPDGATYKDVFRQETMDDMGLTEADIPGTRVSSN